MTQYQNEEEFYPAPGEVFQAEEPAHKVPVCLEDPVRVQELPAKSAGFRSVDLTVGKAVKILERDPRRKRAVILPYDPAGASKGAFIGVDQQAALSPYAAMIPLGTSGIELTTFDDVWASANTAGCSITVINEQWSF